MMMQKRSKRRARWGLLLALAAILSMSTACGSPTPPPPTTTPTSTPPPTSTPLPTFTPVPTPVPDVLFVDAATSLGPISPYVYGAAYGPWVGVPFELWPAAEDSGVTYLRFPGGEWGDQNDLRGYQIDYFMDFAEMMGAEPKINVRMPGGSPEKAAELVEYCNVTNDYDVRYWSIGNEPNLYTPFTMYEDYDTERYNREWREIAQAMREVDPDIVLIGPGTSQFTGDPDYDPKDEAGRDWLREFLKANGDMVDVVAIHRYPFPKTPKDAPPTIEDLRDNSSEWDTIIPNLRAVIRETTGRDLPVAVSEVNSNWSHATGGEATPDSFYNAIWWGDVLGRMIRQKVDIVAYFILQSDVGQGGWGLIAKFDVRPTYYTYQMYKRFGEELLYASSDESNLSVYAAQRADGALTVMLINLASEAKETTLQIANAPTGGEAEIWRFDKDHTAENIGTLVLDERTEITVPAQSMTLYVLPPGN